ncbi:FAD-binding oxidoreductase [Isoptericola sp. 4D.3]|uniref:FAD-binding oxidoreductase n=1 Tax=Isoptericola peretonis TaxID=2918523 RepID=A0ABT0J6H2_9MICO|nr:FAD-binding oxidoreductase [Isoptericola sp. 4D.3]
MSWHVATVVGTRELTATARELTLSVPGFAGALPGQHVDVRLTAPDGYQATRAYSLAEAGDDERVDLVVDEVPGGEVSPYLTRDARPGDQVEVRGPLGGYFVWHDADPGPVLLVAGGSGVVPFLAMLRARRAAGRPAPFRLVCSVRSPHDAIEREEIDTPDPGLEVRWVYTREAPPGWPAPPRRLIADDLTARGFGPGDDTSVFACGPTGFVEAAATLLTGLGHPPARVRTERFGGA